MSRIVSLYGIIAGLIVAVPTIVFMVFVPPQEMQNGVVYGYVTMILALTAVFIGIKHYRDRELGGTIKFGRALLVGLGISAVASLLYAIAWEISLAFSGFDFPAAYTKMTIEAARAKGASPEELDQVAQQAASFVRMYRNRLSIADHVRRNVSRRGADFPGLGGRAAQQPRPAGPRIVT